MSTRSNRKLKKEELEEDEHDESKEEGKPKRKGRASKKSERKAAAESNSEDDNIQIETKDGVLPPSASHDHLLKEVATVHRGSAKGVWLTFGRNRATLRNVIQTVCQNYNGQGRAPSSKVSLDDLFYARAVFQNLISGDAQPAAKSSEEAEEEDGSDSVEQHLARIQNGQLQQERQTYLGGSGAPAGLEELLEWLEVEVAERITESNALIKKGLANFDALGELFKPGTKVIGRSRDTGPSPIGYQVVYSRYHSRQTLMGKYRWFTIRMEFVASNGISFLICNHHGSMDSFLGNIPLHKLEYQLMNKEAEKSLTERGKLYVKLSLGHHYYQYDSDSFSIHHQTSGFDRTTTNTRGDVSSFIRAKGRVMLDTETGRRLGHFAAEKGYPGVSTILAIQEYHQQKVLQQQNQQLYNYRFQNSNQNTNELPTVPESMLSLCWPAIAGFSFSAKVWGHVVLDGLSEIKFDDLAFHQLVLAPERKQLILAMVKHSEGIFKDIIIGKGGGSVFLLHGPPGVGKTLTAEAVAEMLHKPLYSVTMGELGVQPTELEGNLRTILELATTWGALVLMDEADIFLERRGQKEIVRNAMVGVMMRLIEYFQGVLFLTSNRVTCFDEAFHSRITVALQYNPLTKEIRKSVWDMLLSAAKIKGADTSMLSEFPLNGRQIKNCICLAQGLAKSDGTDVTPIHISHTVKVCMEFQEEMEQSKSSLSYQPEAVVPEVGSKIF